MFCSHIASKRYLRKTSILFSNNTLSCEVTVSYKEESYMTFTCIFTILRDAHSEKMSVIRVH